MRLECKVFVEDIETAVKTQKQGEDEPIRVVANITLEASASPELMARITALHQLCAQGHQVSAVIGCDQATFELDIQRVDAEARKIS